MTPPIITLTSDFGTQDGYVAAMKGVILGILPEATLIDISHDLPAHDIPHAAFVLGTIFRYFPKETVHLAVVDPGVGTSRRALMLVTPGGRFIAPDNGLLSYALMAYGASTGSIASAAGETVLASSMTAREVELPTGCRAYVLDRCRYRRHPVSDTFHGRDIFAPVAAHLAAGVSAEELGTATDTVTCLDVPLPARENDVILGEIIHIDRFGNLVSNIQGNELAGRGVETEIEGVAIQGLSRSYAGGQGLLAIIGSHGYLEVALREGSAAQRLGARVGTGLKVTLD